jgi:hypothetical protein
LGHQAKYSVVNGIIYWYIGVYTHPLRLPAIRKVDAQARKIDPVTTGQNSTLNISIRAGRFIANYGYFTIGHQGHADPFCRTLCSIID